ncbi:MAG: hypothetical protein Q8K75_06335 [Chlamydiales bacterium]|nr:hypothetical protein [Chlamydiales bacterium]
MVSRYCLLLLLFACSFAGVADAARVKISAQMDASRTAEHRRMEGRVFVFHVPADKVDVSGFELEKKPLSVEYVQDRTLTVDELRNDVTLDPETVVSEYRFQLPGKAKGLYILPSIGVVVDGKRYRSVATTYEVTAATATSDLELEAIIEGEQPFYPGQHATVKYRIYYNRNIELTEEHLPLLEAEGLQKIGEKEVSDAQTDVYTVQEISQEVRITEPGTYTFGPSVIEGVSYSEDRFGKRKYDKQRLRAIAPAVSVEAVAFPEQGRPASFTGAVGQFIMKGRLLTLPKLDMGEKVEVGVRISGGPDVEDVVMSDVSCQPGFSGFFQIGDYPPFEQRDKLSKEFILNFRPLSAHITEVPTIEFSYFDPAVRQYKTLRTEPIPIEVRSLVSYKPDMRFGRPEEQVQKFGPKEDQSPGLIQDRGSVSGMDWRIWLGKPSDVKISGVYPLTAQDLVSSRWTITFMWVSIGILLTLLLLQLGARKLRGSQPLAPRVLGSADYLALASQSKNDPARMTSLIEEAFMLLMVEKGWYPKKVSRPEQLAHEGVIGQIRAFLIEMAGKRYGGAGGFIPRDILKSAKELYRSIRYGQG